jgi:hypothetical protein
MLKLVAVLVAAGALAASATAADRIHQIQVRGHDTGTFSLAPGPSPGIFLSTDVGSGVASHLGPYDFVAHEVFDAADNVVTQATFTITTKHGTLYGNYTATIGVGATPNISTYHAPGSITGGTGRYAGATGTIVFDGFGDLQSYALDDRFAASIRLPRDVDDD